MNGMPSRRHANVVQSRIVGSLLQILMTPAPKLPSASKIPARKPLSHSSEARPGHAMSSLMVSMEILVDARIACISRCRSVEAANWKPVVSTFSSRR